MISSLIQELDWSKTYDQTQPYTSFGMTVPTWSWKKSRMPPSPSYVMPRSHLLDKMAVGACTCLRGLRRESGGFIPKATMTKCVTPTSNIAVKMSVVLAKIYLEHRIGVSCGPLVEIILQMAFFCSLVRWLSSCP